MKKLFLSSVLIACASMTQIQGIGWNDFHSDEYNSKKSETESWGDRCHREHQERFQKLLAEQERKEYLRKENQRKLRDQRYVEEMMRDYTVPNHSEYVSCIIRSALPEKTKTMLIDHFNSLYEKEKANTLNLNINSTLP